EHGGPPGGVRSGRGCGRSGGRRPCREGPAGLVPAGDRGVGPVGRKGQASAGVPAKETLSRETLTPSTVRLGVVAPTLTPVTVPVWACPEPSVQVTVRPISDAAVCWRPASNTFWVSSASSLSFSTVVNWAVWVRNCAGSVGLLGSWYLSWAIRSFRNMSWLISFGSL